MGPHPRGGPKPPHRRNGPELPEEKATRETTQGSPPEQTKL